MLGCYILFSQKINKFYIGTTQSDLVERISKHNNGTYGRNHFTAIANDWYLYFFIETTDFAHAIRIERKIKAMKSKKYIENLAKYPEMLKKLVSST